MPGSWSRHPMRIATSVGSSGLIVWVWLPHSAQKAFRQPSPGSQTRTLSSPAMTEKAPGGQSAVVECVVPERRWQRLQWQYRAATNGSVVETCTAPHMQRPVIGLKSSDTTLLLSGGRPRFAHEARLRRVTGGLAEAG